MTASNCTLHLDPHLVGAGIRVPIYALTLAQYASDLFTPTFVHNGLNMALAIVSSGLSAACLISALQNKLDLFHAYCVIHLLILAIQSTRGDDNPNPPVDDEDSTWSFCKRVLLRLPSAVNLIGLFILFNDVFADPASYGATAECNSQARLSVLGAAIHSTSGVIPWLASILILFGTIYTLVILYQQVNWFALMIKAEREALRSRSRFLKLHFVTPAAKAVKSLRRFYNRQAAKVLNSLINFYDPQLAEDVMPRQRFYYNGRVLTEFAYPKFRAFFIQAAFDMGWCALAGLTAAAAGARASKIPTTHEVLRLGAFAGVVKCALVNLALIFCRAVAGDRFMVAVIFIASSFMISFIFTACVAQRAIVPDPLTYAAMAAAAPLLCSNVTYILPVRSSYGRDCCGIHMLLIFLAGDALSGYTFAKVAQNHGYDAIQGNIAASMLVVFALLQYVGYAVGREFIEAVNSGFFDRLNRRIERSLHRNDYRYRSY